MSYVPHLYIGIGETGALYTLRETYLHVSYVGNTPHKEVRSFHHFNLSQNADEALAKAQHYAEQMALELRADRESLEGEMRKITRASAEELAAREERIRKAQEEWEANKLKLEAEKREKIANGIFPFGRYFDEKFEDAPIGYLTWLIENVNTFEGMLKEVAEAVKAKCSHMMLPKPDSDAIVGEVKQRLVLDVIVTKTREIWRDSFSGWGQERVFIVEMMDKKTKACIMSFSTAFNAEEGEELTIKATVKKHDEYKGQAQTVVTRVTVQ